MLPKIVIKDELVMLQGRNGSEQWILRLDSARAKVVQRRAFIPMHALATFVGAEMSDPRQAAFMFSVYALWESGRIVADVARLVVSLPCTEF